MRERRNSPYRKRFYDGITPAYAGKTSIVSEISFLDGDHPRVCGKDIEKEEEYCNIGGSPPRMRERRGQGYATPANARITPAYAGKTHTARCRDEGVRDHPRVCGKDICRSRLMEPTAGSPPRMRERRHQRHELVAETRITPAYAGKTSRATESPSQA